jgi:hypothetical protein
MESDDDPFYTMIRSSFIEMYPGAEVRGSLRSFQLRSRSGPFIAEFIDFHLDGERLEVRAFNRLGVPLSRVYDLRNPAFTMKSIPGDFHWHVPLFEERHHDPKSIPGGDSDGPERDPQGGG